MVFRQLPQAISPCRVTFARKVVRQCGQVMVGTERVGTGVPFYVARGPGALRAWRRTPETPLQHQAGRRTAVDPTLLPFRSYSHVEHPGTKPDSGRLRPGSLGIPRMMLHRVTVPSQPTHRSRARFLKMWPGGRRADLDVGVADLRRGPGPATPTQRSTQ
jgi:hypothetical protein